MNHRAISLPIGDIQLKYVLSNIATIGGINGFSEKRIGNLNAKNNLNWHIQQLKKKRKKYVTISYFEDISEHIANIQYHHGLTEVLERSRNSQIFYINQKCDCPCKKIFSL